MGDQQDEHLELSSLFSHYCVAEFSAQRYSAGWNNADEAKVIFAENPVWKAEVR
jgi:hypothetical protein